jgi:Mrp family chromosome partitioning ATPase/uncharacterized protein involved in exopolysaccharide biosynthesis
MGLDEKTDLKPETGNGSDMSSLSNGSGNHETGDVFDYIRFLQILIIQKWLFLSVFTLIVVISVLYALRQPVSFQAKFDVFYSESVNRFVTESNLALMRTDFDKDYWLGIMNSDEIMTMTFENAGIAEGDESKPKISISLRKDKDRTLPIYEVSITAKDNLIIPLLIRSYVQALNDMLHKEQYSNFEQLVDYLSKQIEEKNNQISTVDRAIIAEQAKNPTALRDLRKVSDDIETFRNDLLHSQINLAAVRATKRRAEEDLLNLDGTIVLESAYAEPLKVQLMNLQVDLARSLTRMQEDHPSVKALRENIYRINDMIRDSISQRLEITGLKENPLKTQLMSKVIDLQLNEISLENRILAIHQVITEFEMQMLPDTTDKDQFSLMRTRELLLMTINQLNMKYLEAQSAANVSLSRFLIIGEPKPPTSPSGKNLKFFILAGILGALLCGFAAVFIYDMLDNRIMVIADYERFFKIPVLGTIMSKPDGDHYFESDDYEESYAQISESIEILIGMRKSISCKKHKLFALCSPLRGEGKSFVSMQIARAFAMKEFNTLLVDMDFAAPRLTRQILQDESFTIIDALYERCEIDEVIFPTDHPKLHFTSVGTMKQHSGFITDKEVFITFIEKVRSHFDVVIFDTPAMLIIPEIIGLMSRVDEIIPVIRLRHTNRTSLNKMLKMLNAEKSKITGAIINDLKPTILDRNSPYYYNYTYEYYKGTKRKKTRTKQKKSKLKHHTS